VVGPLIDGALGLANFDDSAVQRLQVKAAIRRIRTARLTDCVARGLPAVEPRLMDELFVSGLKFDVQANAATWLLALR
jgi:hypothetical protein